MLITAGPTHEPIDAVRFIGNRSSGRVGIELARAAADAGWRTTLLLGPTALDCDAPGVEVRRFTTVDDLQSLLDEHFPRCEVLVMAAAVADYRPCAGHRPHAAGKLKRSEGGLTLRLEPTPDLLAACSAARRPGQTLIGFALEPAERMMASALEKIARKGLDAIIANPLRTMDAPDIEAAFVRAGGDAEPTPGPMPKAAFARWLLQRIGALHAARRA